ncbi:hypothetical protein I3J14_00735, partial [Streptomyces sp. HB-N217]|nr:hypothetical protein [Streptomyces sp. HB-N217]
REGTADVMVTGASDAPISPITLTCFDVIKATSARNDDPETACWTTRCESRREPDST